MRNIRNKAKIMEPSFYQSDKNMLVLQHFLKSQKNKKLSNLTMTKSSRHEYPMKNKLSYSIEYKLNSSRPVSKKKKKKDCSYDIKRPQQGLSKTYFAGVQQIYDEIISQNCKNNIKQIPEWILYFLGTALKKINENELQGKITYQQFRHQCQKIYRKSNHNDIIQFINLMSHHKQKTSRKFKQTPNNKIIKMENQQLQIINNNKLQVKNNIDKQSQCLLMMNKTPDKSRKKSKIIGEKDWKQQQQEVQHKTQQPFLSHVPITSSVQSKKYQMTPASILNKYKKQNTVTQQSIPQNTITNLQQYDNSQQQPKNISKLQTKSNDKQYQQNLQKYGKSIKSDRQIRQQNLLETIYSRMNSINKALQQLPNILVLKQTSNKGAQQKKCVNRNCVKQQTVRKQDNSNKQNQMRKSISISNTRLEEQRKLRQKYLSANAHKTQLKNGVFLNNVDKIDKLACKLQEHIRKNAAKIENSKHARIML